jgi:hypothetical protein
MELLRSVDPMLTVIDPNITQTLHEIKQFVEKKEGDQRSHNEKIKL